MKNKQVEPQVEQDVGQLEGGEFFGFPFQAQVGERDQRQGVEKQDEDDIIEQPAVEPRDFHQAGEGLAQQQQRPAQQQRRQDDGEVRRGEGPLFLLRGGERTEFHEGGVHAVDVENVQERQVGVDVGVYPHVAAGDEMGVKRDQQEAEEAADDGRDAVDRRVLGQFPDLFTHVFRCGFPGPCPHFTVILSLCNSFSVFSPKGPRSRRFDKARAMDYKTMIPA